MKALALLLFCVFTSMAFAQASGDQAKTAASNAASQMPSRQEIEELLNKATQKVTALQAALKNVKPILDKIDPDAYKQDEEACETAIYIIGTIKKNGTSAYALVSLVGTLDDLKVDATSPVGSLTTQALKLDGMAQTLAVTDISNFIQAGTGCYDMSELLLHATLRYISAEESLLNEIMAAAKQP